MNFYDTTFYDKASSEYSERRYFGKTESYIQFFFKRRLALILESIKKIVSNKNDPNLLDVGCADGIVIDKILENFPSTFFKAVGVDISPEMIEVAKKRNSHKNVSYYLKNTNEASDYDVVLATGFLSPSIFDQEFDYIKNHLKPDGIVILSLSSKDSLYTKIKLQEKDYIKDYWDFSQYEEYLKKDFEIIDSFAYGLFIPKLWFLPGFARITQPFLENLFKFLPSLFHEKLYVLKHKR